MNNKQQQLVHLKTQLADYEQLVAELKKEIDKFQPTDDMLEVGEVVEVRDGVAKISGLYNCQMQEILQIGESGLGIAINLEQDAVGCILLQGVNIVQQGDIAKRTGTLVSIPVSDQILGRVVNPLAQPVDGGAEISPDKRMPLEKVAPGVITREPVKVPLQTGIKAIDALIPIGRGQRELILGDRQTGKTALAIDTILNQKDQDVICVYVAIGQKESKVAQILALLKKTGAIKYTTVVLAGASDAPAMLYLAPYAGVSIAEYFADKGKDVLVIYDDLTKHAVAYREISLLLRRPPGREAFPGDVFYLHSRLLERACNLTSEYGGGSITALPIIETQAGDISAYIPTNVISITDGQIFLESDLFYKGVRPAVNVGLSVSRVGSSAQTKPMKKVAGKLRLEQAQYREVESFAQFSDELDADTKAKIARGKRVAEVLKQKQYSPMPVEQQVLSLYALSTGFFDQVDLDMVQQAEQKLIDYVHRLHPQLLASIASGEWGDDTEKQLSLVIQEYR